MSEDITEWQTRYDWAFKVNEICFIAEDAIVAIISAALLFKIMVDKKYNKDASLILILVLSIAWGVLFIPTHLVEIKERTSSINSIYNIG